MVGRSLTFVFAKKQCFEVNPLKMNVSKVVTNFVMAAILLASNGICRPRWTLFLGINNSAAGNLNSNLLHYFFCI